MALDLNRIYAYRHRRTDASVRAAVWTHLSRRLADEMGRPSRVLDPAAGLCEFINAVPAAERWAVDLHFTDADRPAPGVRSIAGDALTTDLPSAYFDGIFVSNFLEHLPSPDAVSVFLTRMHECLAPGGRIAIMGPNFRYCTAEYYDFADHLLPLSHVTVEEHLIGTGYDLVRTIPRFMPYSFRSAPPLAPLVARLYLSFPALWRIAGKQFLVIAAKA